MKYLRIIVLFRSFHSSKDTGDDSLSKADSRLIAEEGRLGSDGEPIGSEERSDVTATGLQPWTNVWSL